jgi:hypothetical protein
LYKKLIEIEKGEFTDYTTDDLSYWL